MCFQNSVLHTLTIIVTVTIIFTIVFMNGMIVLANESESFSVTGKLSECFGWSKIKLSDLKSNSWPVSTLRGELKLSGDIAKDEKPYGTQAFVVSNDNITISYKFPWQYVKDTHGLDEWYLFRNCFLENIDGTDYKKDIGSGAIIVRGSSNGRNWHDILAIRDAFKGTNNYYKTLYSPTSIEINNGYYYKVIVVYELKKDYINNKKKKTTDYSRRCETYTFYVHSSDNELNNNDNVYSPGTLVNAGSRTGYVENKSIDIKDPHYGWELGHFYIKGYTRQTEKSDGTPVFLKNVGDKVTLSFKLEQDINKLNGNNELSIAYDDQGSDQYFQINKTVFGRGMLIVRYTDEKNIKHEPVKYVNFLEANAQKGTDTIVQVYEEGDYEVALDYEIKKAPVNVLGLEVFPSYTAYRISFKFSIRNGNCMVYPFDLESGSELSDMAIAPNGFRLDTAKSRYLNIDMDFYKVEKAGNTYREDQRSNKPSKDGNSYTEEGIYKFKVNNLYTGEETEKTIFVGTDPALYAMSVNRISVEELNKLLKEGYEIGADGELYLPSEEKPTDDQFQEEYYEVEQAENELPEGENDAEHREHVLDKVELAEKEFAERYNFEIDEYDPELSREKNLEDNWASFTGTVNNMYIEEVLRSPENDDELVYEASIYLHDEDDDLWVVFVELVDGAFDIMYDECVGKEVYMEGMILSVEDTVPLVYGDYIEIDSDDHLNQFMTPWIFENADDSSDYLAPIGLADKYHTAGEALGGFLSAFSGFESDVIQTYWDNEGVSDKKDDELIEMVEGIREDILAEEDPDIVKTIDTAVSLMFDYDYEILGSEKSDEYEVVSTQFASYDYMNYNEVILEKYYEKLAKLLVKNSDTDDETMTKAMWEAVIEVLKEADKTYFTKVDIACYQEDGVWYAEINDECMNAMMGDLDNFLEESAE